MCSGVYVASPGVVMFATKVSDSDFRNRHPGEIREKSGRKMIDWSPGI